VPDRARLLGEPAASYCCGTGIVVGWFSVTGLFCSRLQAVVTRKYNFRQKAFHSSSFDLRFMEDM
jgi:hypothetical protein